MAEKKFKLFDSQREGKGVEKGGRKLGYDLYSFFVRMGRNMGKLFSINLLYVVGNFPLFFALIGFAGYFNIKSTTPADPVFPLLHGMMTIEDSPALAALFGVHGGQSELSSLGTGSIIMFALSLLAIFTFGPVNAGCAHLLRDIVSGEPVFVMEDFISTVKKNIRQALPFGIIDLAIWAILIFDLRYFSRVLGTIAMNMMFYATLLCAILYFMMRYYIYMIMVTFDLTLFKIFKNSLIFSILALGRNLLALLGIAVIGFINVMLAFYIPGLGIALPFLITIALMCYTASFPAYYKIKNVMIDPYYEKKKTAE